VTVTRDATSGFYCPANLAEWNELLANTGILPPSLVWDCQDTSGALVDSIGGHSGTAHGAPQYGVTVSGWSRLAVAFPTVGNFDGFLNTDSTLPDITTVSMLCLGYIHYYSQPSTTNQGFMMGATNVGGHAIWHRVFQNGQVEMVFGAALEGNNIGAPASGAMLPVLMGINHAASGGVIQTDHGFQTNAIAGSNPTGKGVRIGSPDSATDGAANAPLACLYFTSWFGTAAEMTNDQRQLLMDLIRNGPLAGRTITRDATSGWYVPANAGEWFLLLNGRAGLGLPVAVWDCQVASGSLLDPVTHFDLAPTGSPLYHQTVSGWSRFAVTVENGGVFGNYFDKYTANGQQNDAIGNISFQSNMLLHVVSVDAGNTSQGMGLGATKKLRAMGIPGSHYHFDVNNATATFDGTHDPGTVPQILIMQGNETTELAAFYAGLDAILPPTAGYFTPSPDAYLVFGDSDNYGGTKEPKHVLYGVLWRGPEAEYTQTQVASLMFAMSHGPMVSVTVTPSTHSMNIGATFQLTATLNYGDGTTQDVTSLATWSSSSPANATVNGTGLVTGVAAGGSFVSAAYEGFSGGGSTITVVPAVSLTSIEVIPSTLDIGYGTATALQAIAIYSDSHTVDVTTLATWASSNPSAATVDSNGTLVAIAKGVTTITATYTFVGSAMVTVIGYDSYKAKVMRHMLPPPYKQDFSGTVGKILTVIGQSDNIIGGLFGSDDFLPDEG
jgi:hypothetical protein